MEKGEERHKKNLGGLSLANSFWQREKGMKEMNSTILFSRFGKLENFGKLLEKEEEEEEEVQRDLRVVKDCNDCS